MKLFLDLDGVFADFQTGALSLLNVDISNYDNDKKVRNTFWFEYEQNLHIRFYRNLPLLPDAMELWEYVKPHNPIFLSSCGRKSNYDDIAAQKTEWVYEKFGKVPIIVTLDSKSKSVYADTDAILVDDRNVSIIPWVEKNGIGVHHKNARNTIKILKTLL